MASLRVQRRRGTRGEDGASLVEFALISPLLFMLLLGTLTGGLTLSRQNSVKNAVREGARYGAVLELDPTSLSAYLSDVLTQAQAGASGDLHDDVDGQYICASVTYSSGTPVVYTAKKMTRTAGVNSAVLDGHCFVDSRPSTETRVQVVAARRSEISAILFNANPRLESQAVTRYER